MSQHHDIGVNADDFACNCDVWNEEVFVYIWMQLCAQIAHVEGYEDGGFEGRIGGVVEGIELGDDGVFVIVAG